MKKFLSRFVLVLLISSLYFLLSAPPALAQTATCTPDATQVKLCTDAGMDTQSCETIQCVLQDALSRKNAHPEEWWNPTLNEFSSKVFDGNPSEIFGERYTYAQVNWIINSIFTMFLPRANKMQDIIGLFQIIQELQETGQVPAQLQPMADIFNYPFTHPVASAKDEAVRAISNFQIVPPAYAQGIGFSKLNSGAGNIRTLWTATRNMAYLISIILLISAGFMVMFRSKINPQTVVTVQMILPKLALSLLLITFSFAIVGLVLDLVYVFLTAFLGFLSITGVSSMADLSQNISILTSANSRFFASAFLGAYTWIVIAIAIFMVIFQLWDFFGLAGLVYLILAVLLGLLVWAVISGVRILVTLFLAYLNLVILTIIGPLQIMTDVFPSQKNIGFVPWIKCVIGNASVLVIAGILAIVAVIFFNISNSSGLRFTGITGGLNPGFSLPFVGGGGYLFGHINVSLGDITQIGSGAGWLMTYLFLPMVFFQAAPDLMNSIKNALCKGPDPSQQIADSINNVVKQLTGGKPASKAAKTGLLPPG
ncbi:MAG: hypothetical protein UX80_C0006G0072 [Candidatus Amesbacteria bacterium GW2011_GWA2_47_11b]|uniref:Type IV secretion system protein n=2 Tax=Candidatus Amesiibacteriota TaxID=1752730 RepID=A0A0G1SI87_9BACT|nr:MAG: hypothetical protein UX42_C0003G0066 [Microgenomates group bacterium GW2011_GWC1_46_20]KKU58102.1 MAG: hypothetical protein UX80_C0006G0072 [Candidatus Amesbacteria bacterium GW2011_GWA2_47_11b]KKU69149.1 MAG: hypothetical protein UX92_C0014G0040 [Candidatus Amesbacteria bacterium GW2011_GWA1_47_20]